MNRFEGAIARFDELNASDPNQEAADGVFYPKELLYAQRMTARLRAFVPDAPEPLRLAARCQHIQRWTVPRADYPMGSMGYKKWRNELKRFHAKTASVVLETAGYDAASISRVKDLIMKKGLKSDPDVQALEDVICLVFLEHYAEHFAEKHEPEKVVNILKKTWKKMSAQGHAAALELPLSQEMMALVGKAVTEA